MPSGNRKAAIVQDPMQVWQRYETPDKPKFALRPLWEFGLLPSFDALVGPGGQCEGAVVVHQEDNAG